VTQAKVMDRMQCLMSSALGMAWRVCDTSQSDRPHAVPHEQFFMSSAKLLARGTVLRQGLSSGHKARVRAQGSGFGSGDEGFRRNVRKRE